MTAAQLARSIGEGKGNSTEIAGAIGTQAQIPLQKDATSIEEGRRKRGGKSTSQEAFDHRGTMAELAKLCKGAQKTWPDGRNFTLVIHDPVSPGMRGPVQKLFGVAASEVKPQVAKLNESRPVIRIVEPTRATCGRWKPLLGRRDW